MIARNGDTPLDDGALAARTRRARLYRAASALALMSMLLAGLLLDDDAVAPGGDASALGMAAPTASVVLPKATLAPFDSGVRPPLESATAAAPVEQGHPPVASVATPAVSDALATSAPVAAEPVHAVDAPVAPVAVPANPDTLKAEHTATEPASVTANPASGTAATAVDGSAALEGFRVQLGQFADMRGATALRDTLSRQGYAARLQVRVGVGPYEQRKAAESALAKMRRERGLGGLIVAPPSGKGLIVQLGVFAEQRNADELAARMKAWGYATRLHARVVVGPYPDQQSAQAALRRLQRERTLEGVVIMPAS